MPQETLYDAGIDQINVQLAEKYGREVSSNRPIFRIINSNSTTEKRLGDYNDFTNSGIFIRSVREVREVLKYAYLRDTWILERLTWIGGGNPELPEAKGYEYETVWAFRSKYGEPLYPHFNIVVLLLDILVNGPKVKKTEADWEYEEEQKKLKESAEYFDMLESEGRSNLFAFEDAVFMDSTKRFEDKDV
jgi:hypothetical protein